MLHYKDYLSPLADIVHNRKISHMQLSFKKISNEFKIFKRNLIE